MEMRNTIIENPVLAIMRNVSYDQTVDYVNAVIEGGISFFEVALNSPRAFEQIALIRKNFGDRCIVGAGTAITPVLCEKALDSGAQFLLTPGTTVSVFEYCAKHNVALLPGVLTPSEVAMSLEFGYNTMKLFPAGDMAMKYVKDLKGPYSGTEYVAIGGVNIENAISFMEAGYLGIGLASNLMPKGAVQENKWELCVEQIKKLTEAINAFRKK